MIVLAIHDGHDSSACLLRDGELLLGSAEERRVNRKNYAGTPMESIRAILQRTGVRPQQIDLVAIGCKIRTRAPDRDKGQEKMVPVLHFAGSLGRYQWSTSVGQWLLERVNKRQGLYDFLEEIGVTAPAIKLDHHATHAACAYYHRPWNDDALVLTLD